MNKTYKSMTLLTYLIMLDSAKSTLFNGVEVDLEYIRKRRGSSDQSDKFEFYSKLYDEGISLEQKDLIYLAECATLWNMQVFFTVDSGELAVFGEEAAQDILQTLLGGLV